MLDTREDVEVCECGKNEDGYAGLNGRKDGVSGKRPQYSTHFGERVGGGTGACGGEDEARGRPNKWRE